MYIKDEKGNEIPVEYVWEIGEKYKEQLLKEEPNLEPLTFKYKEKWYIALPNIDRKHWKFKKMLKKRVKLTLVFDKRKVYYPDTREFDDISIFAVLDVR